MEVPHHCTDARELPDRRPVKRATAAAATGTTAARRKARVMPDMKEPCTASVIVWATPCGAPLGAGGETPLRRVLELHLCGSRKGWQPDVRPLLRQHRVDPGSHDEAEHRRVEAAAHLHRGLLQSRGGTVLQRRVADDHLGRVDHDGDEPQPQPHQREPGAGDHGTAGRAQRSYSATAMISMEPTSGRRGPILEITEPASGDPTITIAVSGSSHASVERAHAVHIR